MSFAKRFDNFQPFGRVKSSNDDRNNNLEFGFVTYSNKDEQETYQVTSFEMGGRSDHLSDLVLGLTGTEPDVLTTDAPLEGDADLLRKAPEPKSAKPASEASA